MKSQTIVAICAAVIVFISGIGAGIWFSTNYKIVPIDVALPMPPPVEAPPLPQPPEPVTFKPVPEAVPMGASDTGLFSYDFTPGERLHYRLNAEIGGTGIDMGSGSAINMSMGSNFSLLTESVDAAGNGDLRMDFNDMFMTGDFMGSPVNVHESAGRTTMQLDERTQFDSYKGDDTQNIPQLDFFRKPVNMKVAKNGEVLRVSGAHGMEQMLTSLIQVPGMEIPSAEAGPGYQWESRFNMPIPGFGTAARAKAINTLTGYTTINGHDCAVVEQEIVSEQKDGTLNSPESLLGPNMQFAMPAFNLSGHNTIYFDTENGKLVRSDFDLDLGLEIGGEIGDIASSIANIYADALNAAENPHGRPKERPKSESLDIGVNVKASMDLIEEEEDALKAH